ncbi:hypothetical protein BKA80DRAFT_64457 [Phyllosticta citrichinensis]
MTAPKAYTWWSTNAPHAAAVPGGLRKVVVCMGVGNGETRGRSQGFDMSRRAEFVKAADGEERGRREMVNGEVVTGGGPMAWADRGLTASSLLFVPSPVNLLNPYLMCHRSLHPMHHCTPAPDPRANGWPPGPSRIMMRLLSASVLTGREEENDQRGERRSSSRRAVIVHSHASSTSLHTRATSVQRRTGR